MISGFLIAGFWMFLVSEDPLGPNFSRYGRFWECMTGVAITDGPNIKVCKARRAASGVAGRVERSVGSSSWKNQKMYENVETVGFDSFTINLWGVP